MHSIIIAFIIIANGLSLTCNCQDLKQPVQQSDNSIVFVQVDSMPDFNGTEGSTTDIRIKNFINSNLKWKANPNCKGIVAIQVIVEKDGTLTNFKFLSSLKDCDEFNQEVMRVIKLFPKFKAGKQGGKPVRVYWVFVVKAPNV